MEISKQLRFYRSQNHLTQDAVAHALNISRKTVSGWENGRSKPDIVCTAKLCRLYGISFEELITAGKQ
ncbi:helix-turn-helix transcriptional regulator [Lentilactobacillus otakiensis]|mgnify:CR=1 FL=1|uniref:HTH cro/C1-type domain-containing protein n=1 Tax=Lentilactobacillus otakiensis DSM 19908 = JCM 15040 TaxID=1423780 RepID=S4PQH1_9LACO|nr:helix-turn-helix transcriptional regulator [Lentilactobacillus otakiensis]KRL10899.1 hypothetical protein FD05_GL000048 [Lentilactobacillus otakiensis DSM 19908 = JCM 15040]MBZ3777409.1 helix-turn-helix domain-containing protein [Lentilactobacillus otakiensis]MDV3517727.1 helix-turn-helix transcriptional regulator [Lentilactobacillus otakiensis]GAD17235.1 hypothetical protein LOT_1773 [Lentilactobacillus otakiensis DSM 19908 = JCM 15040]